MTPERIAELRALCGAATPGPWATHLPSPESAYRVLGRDRTVIVTVHRNGMSPQPRQTADSANAAFIAAARSAVPGLLDEVERLTNERADVDRARREHQNGRTVDAMAAAGVLAERDAQIRALTAERDELRATLANERGEGEGPSEGWVAHFIAGAWLARRWVHVASKTVISPGEGGWYWDRDWGVAEGAEPTAREAMRQADLARVT